MRGRFMAAYWERVLNRLVPTESGQVPELYFPEELHAASLRQKFEELHPAERVALPLRIALDKL